MNSSFLTGLIIGAAIFLFAFQVFILFKIKNILQQISIYIESISKFFYRVGLNSVKQAPPVQASCQLCKHRLSFIHMNENKGEVNDFYYKCQKRNLEVKLDDVCAQFERENNS